MIPFTISVRMPTGVETTRTVSAETYDDAAATLREIGFDVIEPEQAPAPEPKPARKPKA